MLAQDVLLELTFGKEAAVHAQQAHTPPLTAIATLVKAVVLHAPMLLHARLALLDPLF